MMAKNIDLKKNTKNSNNNSKRFLAVDVWRAKFGPVSVRAIFDVYSQKFKVEPHNMKKYTLTHCINALRSLENPDYITPQDVSYDSYERVY